MKLLILGGTGFVGRAFTEAAIANGHEITLFNRGHQNPDLFSAHEQIFGDRGVDLSALSNRTWDAVFDSSGYLPRVVKMSAERLKDSVHNYLFISTISVYENFSVPNQDENSALKPIINQATEEVTGETYGPFKVACEDEVVSAFGNRSTIVRPGLVVGPHDTTDRFTYWPLRMHEGGDVLVPDVKEQPCQFIDARDLGEWCLKLIEESVTGIFNAVGPPVPYRLEDVLTACAIGTYSNLIWASPEFLNAHDVQPWRDLPFVLGFDRSGYGMTQMNVSKAVAAGLRFRPLAETVQDTLQWSLSLPSDRTWKVGLPRAKEAEVIREWKRLHI